MDVYCKFCGEPWDNDTLHGVAQSEGTSYAVVAKRFRKTGCQAIEQNSHACFHHGANPHRWHGAKACPECAKVADVASAALGTLSRAEAAAIAYEVCGGDMDGAASIMGGL